MVKRGMFEAGNYTSGHETHKRLKRELSVSQSMLLRGIDVSSRFVIDGTSGDRIVVLTNMPASGESRRTALHFFSNLIAFQMTEAFVYAAQTIAPATLTAVLVSTGGYAAATQTVQDLGASFGEIVFHDPRHTDLDILNLFPRLPTCISQEALDHIQSFMVDHEIAPNTYILEI